MENRSDLGGLRPPFFCKKGGNQGFCNRSPAAVNRILITGGWRFSLQQAALSATLTVKGHRGDDPPLYVLSFLVILPFWPNHLFTHMKSEARCDPFAFLTRGEAMLYEPIIRGFRRACPKCAEGRLQWRNWRHWQHISQEGRRACDHLVYYECDRCRCRLKIFRGGLIRDADEREWSQFCEPERNQYLEPSS